MFRPDEIISGGQTGVDRAALLFAREAGIPYRGWVPLGGLAEDFRGPPGIRAEFPDLLETETSNYAEPTGRNVRDCDFLLIIARERNLTEDTALSARLAREYKKPYRIITFSDTLPEVEGCVMVTGPRESIALGIQEETLNFLLEGK